MPDSDESLHCWRCDYDLSGRHEEEVCPECGLRVSVARQQVAPFTIGSRSQKWAYTFALLSFVPCFILGFVFLVADEFVSGRIQTSMYYGGIAAFTLASITGTTAGWCMRVPKLPSSATSYASVVFCVSLFPFVPIMILGEGLLGNTWSMVLSDLFLILIMCALGTLSLQAKVFAQRLGMGRPAKHTISFSQVSHLAFVSAGLIALGTLMSAAHLVPLSGRPPGLAAGFGILLGILASGIWMLRIVPIVYQLARWPISGSPHLVRASSAHDPCH